jgi:hypothetical protein
VVLATAAGAIVGSSSSPAPPGSQAAATDPLTRGRGVALGVNLPTLDAAALSGFGHLAGAGPKVVMWYQTWAQPLFYAGELKTVRDAGAIPMITWEPTLNGAPVALSAIVAGRYDGYLKGAAAAATRAGHRIYLRFAHEMNVASSPFGPGRYGNTPAEFVAAWRHVVEVFRRGGATNVEWVWSPNVDCGGKCPFTAFYPGDRWVDWVGLDGYNYSSVNHDPWETFHQVFASSYAELKRLTGKPMMIAETASAEAGGSKARWIADIGPALRSDFPRVRVLVWFDRVKETDWRIDSSAGALEAFRRLVRSPPFAGAGQ